MVACRFIVIKIPFLSKSQNTFPGERGTLPKAGNHSPVKFLDLSSDFPGSHRGTTARLHRNHPGSFSTRPPAPPKDTRRPAHRNSFRPAQVSPETHSPAHRNHPGSTSTRRQLPTGQPPPGFTGTHSPGLRPAQVSHETHSPAHRNHPGSFPPGRQLPRRATTARLTETHSTRPEPEGPARIALCLFPKGETRPAQPDQGGGKPAVPGNYVHQRLQSGNILPQIRGFCKGGEGISSIFSRTAVILGRFRAFPGLFWAFSGRF